MSVSQGNLIINYQINRNMAQHFIFPLLRFFVKTKLYLYGRLILLSASTPRQPHKTFPWRGIRFHQGRSYVSCLTAVIQQYTWLQSNLIIA